MPDKVEQNLLHALQQTGFLNDRQIVFRQETISTNDDARQLAHKGAPSGTVVLAERQSGGRGRMGREWQSAPGHALTFSYLLRPRLEDGNIPQLSLVAGLAVAKALDRCTGLATTIKWPNDILVKGRKVAGVLCEFFPRDALRAEDAVIIGIGINVSMRAEDFSADIRQRATSLLLAGAEGVSRSVLLMAVIEELELQLQRYSAEGFSSILQDWRQRDATLGRRLTWVDVKGTLVEGVSLGPDENGKLLVLDKAGVQREVLSGDVTLASSLP